MIGKKTATLVVLVVFVPAARLAADGQDGDASLRDKASAEVRERSEERRRTVWPSSVGNGKVGSRRRKFVVSEIETTRWECYDPVEGLIWGWFDDVNSTHVSIGSLTFQRNIGTECRESVYYETEVRDCNREADHYALLCDGARLNMTLIKNDGDREQGCGAATIVSDANSGKNEMVMDTLAKMCNNLSSKDTSSEGGEAGTEVDEGSRRRTSGVWNQAQPGCGTPL
eukprot:scaffold10069_cov69-Cylindrotheca_fusiformis.AAC.13